MKNNNSPTNTENGGQLYSIQKTEGTKWAKEHLERTYKRRDEEGKLVMLTPPTATRA